MGDGDWIPFDYGGIWVLVAQRSAGVVVIVCGLARTVLLRAGHKDGRAHLASATAARSGAAARGKGKAPPDSRVVQWRASAGGRRGIRKVDSQGPANGMGLLRAPRSCASRNRAQPLYD